MPPYNPRDKNGKLDFQRFEQGLAHWSVDNAGQTDPFFPLRFWFVGLIVIGYGVYLLFWTKEIASNSLPAGYDSRQLMDYLYFRGWFLLMVFFVYAMAYIKGKFIGLISFVLLCIGCLNFVLDLFSIFEYQLKNPTPRLVLLHLVRLTCLWMLFLNIKNLSRIPAGTQRFDVLLPFRRR
jgi:hypothetical protein